MRNSSFVSQTPGIYGMVRIVIIGF